MIDDFINGSKITKYIKVWFFKHGLWQTILSLSPVGTGQYRTAALYCIQNTFAWLKTPNKQLHIIARALSVTLDFHQANRRAILTFMQNALLPLLAPLEQTRQISCLCHVWEWLSILPLCYGLPSDTYKALCYTLQVTFCLYNFLVYGCFCEILYVFMRCFFFSK